MWKIDTKLWVFFYIQEDQTILHILWSRPKVQDLLSSFKNHCENNDLHFTMDGGSFILGHMLQLPNEHNFTFTRTIIRHKNSAYNFEIYLYQKRNILTTIHKDGENGFFALDESLLKPRQIHFD